MSDQSVVLDQESFLAVNRTELLSAFDKYLLVCGADEKMRSDWADFCENLSLVVSMYYNNLTTKLKESWDMDCARVNPIEEDSCIKAIDGLLTSAQYQTLPRENFEMALAESYDFTLPTTIQWAKYDTRVLSKLYESRGGYLPTMKNEEGIPHFARHIYIAVRGSDQTEKRGYFFKDKINFLIEHSLSKLMRKIQGHAENYNPSSPLTPSRRRRVIESPFKDRVVKRESLQNQIKTQGLSLFTFFSKVTVREPMFKDVIIIYKPLEVARFRALARGVQLLTHNMRRLHSLTDHKGSTDQSQPISPTATKGSKLKIHVEQYHSIPFGDLEALFPFKRITLRPADKIIFAIKLAMTAIFLYMSLVEFLKSKEDNRSMELMTLLLVVGLAQRLHGIITSYRYMSTTYLREIDSWLETKREAQGKSVITKLADEVHHQELMEMLLGYFFLWQHGAMSIDEMNRHVVRFLKMECNMESDFEVEESVRKLLALKLVEQQEVSGGRLRYRLVMTPSQWISKYPVKHISTLSLK